MQRYSNVPSGKFKAKQFKWTCLVRRRPPSIDDGDAESLVALNRAARGFRSSCAPTETHWCVDSSFVCLFEPSYWPVLPSTGTYLTVACSTWGGLQLSTWHGWRKQLMQEWTKESRRKVMRGNQTCIGKLSLRGRPRMKDNAVLLCNNNISERFGNHRHCVCLFVFITRLYYNNSR